ncbi:MAG: hypothetical protein J7K14_03070 [Sulfurimonas sp.]|nr:hypothetical protein [Sulfurimonas sp.]
MNEIKLSVDEKNLKIVMNILENLKDGLIEKIEANSKTSSMRRSTQYRPKTNTIIKEEESGTSDTSGKYINAAAYKNRLKSKK